MIEPITILRTEKTPLRIVSDYNLLFELSSKQAERQRNWFTIKAYEVGEKIVVAVSFESTVPTELGYRDASAFPSRQSAAEGLFAFDPMHRVVGFKGLKRRSRSGQIQDADYLADKDARFRRALKQEWDNLVAEAIARLGLAEEV